jgi:hypothetical protein
MADPEAALTRLLTAKLARDMAERRNEDQDQDNPPQHDEPLNMVTRVLQSELIYNRADADEEELPENRSKTAAFRSGDENVLRFARLMGCETPREAAIAAYESGDMSMITMITATQWLDWDKEMTDMFAVDGDWMSAAQVLQFAFDSGCIEEDGTIGDHHVRFDWDETTCDIARQKGLTQHIEFLDWAHSLPIERQPCKGACNAMQTE